VTVWLAWLRSRRLFCSWSRILSTRKAPKHRYRGPESERLPMLARRLCAQLLGLPRDQFDGALIVLSTAPRWLHFHQRKICNGEARRQWRGAAPMARRGADIS
jgi:hypothetical protein